MTNSTHQVTFAPQISAEQVKVLAEQGFKTIICNRPNGESDDQPDAETIEQACTDANIAFKSIPFSGGMLEYNDIQEFVKFFNGAEQPIYMYCRSGTRSNMLYQAAMEMNLLD